MAKIATIAVATAALCLAALVAVAVGQGEVERQRLKDLRCWQEVQESPLDACRQVLDRQLTGGAGYVIGPYRWGIGLRMQCCQQLQDVSRDCRCAAIRNMVRSYEETMPPLGGQGYYPCSSQAGEGYGESGQQEMFPPEHGEGGQQQPCSPGTERKAKIARVKLTKARQYAAGIPMMCRLSEPQECSVFSGGDRYY